MVQIKVECAICKSEKSFELKLFCVDIFNFNICPQLKCRENAYVCEECFYFIISLEKDELFSGTIFDIEKRVKYVCPFDRTEYELDQEGHFKLLWKIIEKRKKHY